MWHASTYPHLHADSYIYIKGYADAACENNLHANRG
jgi:hypothetical protein